MKTRRIIISVVLGIVLILGLVFLFHQRKTSNTITIGSQGTDTQVWEHIAKSQDAKKLKLKIKVQDFTDSASLDRATAEEKIDVNAFQSYAYFLTFNNSNKKSQQLAALGTTYIQPMGLYSDHYKSVQSIPDGAEIAIANDPAAESRGLKLLESAGLIRLSKHDTATLVTTKDIVENSKELHFKTILSTSAPNALKDKAVAAVTIDNNTAQEAHLNVFKQSIYHEKLEQNTKANVNVLATAVKNAKNKNYKKLVTLYHEPAIQKYIKKEFPAKVEVDKSIRYLKEN